ncbi:MAG TPA: hypothetical protein VGE01_13195 [Fimbriimonas sp.]
MYLALRIELDYVPWDSPDAQDFGHGEAATLLKLLDLARTTGFKYHFFASNRVLRAFPANAEAVLNEGHELDWFCKHPEDAAARADESYRLFANLGHTAWGFCIRGAWQESYPSDWARRFRFMSANVGPSPPFLRHFPVESKPDREAVRTGVSARAWVDGLKLQVRDAASRNRGVTICVRPQVLAKYDARLSFLREILELSQAVGLPNRTFREMLGPDPRDLEGR